MLEIKKGNKVDIQPWLVLVSVQPIGKEDVDKLILPCEVIC